MDFLFAALAWGVPILAIVFHRKWRVSLAVPFLSFICCCVSLTFTVFSLGNRVSVSDWAGLQDVMGATQVLAVVVVVVTVILNLLTLCFREEKKE